MALTPTFFPRPAKADPTIANRRLGIALLGPWAIASLAWTAFLGWKVATVAWTVITTVATLRV